MTLEEKIDHLSNVLSEHIKEDSKMECSAHAMRGRSCHFLNRHGNICRRY